jgi:hypothetical protein
MMESTSHKGELTLRDLLGIRIPRELLLSLWPLPYSRPHPNVLSLCTPKLACSWSQFSSGFSFEDVEKSSHFTLPFYVQKNIYQNKEDFLRKWYTCIFFLPLKILSSLSICSLLKMNSVCRLHMHRKSMWVNSLYSYPYLNQQKPLSLPVIAYTLSTTKLEIRAK